MEIAILTRDGRGGFEATVHIAGRLAHGRRGAEYEANSASRTKPWETPRDEPQVVVSDRQTSAAIVRSQLHLTDQADWNTDGTVVPTE
jgi:hypothetical protein